MVKKEKSEKLSSQLVIKVEQEKVASASDVL